MLSLYDTHRGGRAGGLNSPGGRTQRDPGLVRPHPARGPSDARRGPGHARGASSLGQAHSGRRPRRTGGGTSPRPARRRRRPSTDPWLSSVGSPKRTRATQLHGVGHLSVVEVNVVRSPTSAPRGPAQSDNPHKRFVSSPDREGTLTKMKHPCLEIRHSTARAYRVRCARWLYDHLLGDGRRLGDVPIGQIRREHLGAVISGFARRADRAPSSMP
jgi:hypothetical protein